ncbi:MAG: rhomboid family intramembrane serine protease [Albidovulum sp.]|uniref:rhomboid family intramembrane serine protease n=1 Tax=Albidovulum sp. TaxID=1872424 RepID=UPI003CB66F06
MSQHSAIAPVTWVILILCTVPELLLSGADAGLLGDRGWRGDVYEFGAFWGGLLHDWQPNYPGQPWLMFITYGFLHGGLVHLVMNMTVFVSLAKALVEALGQIRFLLLYTVSLIMGALFFALLGAQDAPMVGASGAIFGLVGAYLTRNGIRRARIGAALRPVLDSVIVLILLNIALWWVLDGQLAWEAHLGGFIAGVAFTLVSGPRRRVG